jgi:dihydrofolate synthase/folylpolyglutamate synthase
MKFASYKDSIDWLFQQFPSYQMIGAGAYKPGLQQTKDLLNALGIQSTASKVIHVAGTNGKGSTCSYISSILTEKGERVGLFTSPHIYDFRERIRINGEQINESAVINFCQKILDLNLEFEPSFFEITFAMALDYFEQNQCSYLVIETGMGGRLDATNVLNSDISIITNIGLDHTQFLGETLGEIAGEKAGIMKPNKPVIIGQTQVEIAPLFKHISNELDAPLFFADRETMEIPETIKLPSLQGINLRTALCALNKLGVAVSEQALIQSIDHLSKNTGLYGRLTKISEHPQLVVDVSHNKEGVSATMKALNDFSFEQLHIIYGASQDKNVEEIVGVFPEDAQIYLVTFSNNRSMEEQQLKEFMKKDARIQSVSTNVNTLLESLRSSVSPKDFILVTGSFFLLSDLKH